MKQQYPILFNQPRVYSILCLGTVYSFFFWPLLNSVCMILLAAYWLFFSTKTFQATSSKSRLLLLFLSIFVINLIGMMYTSNMIRGILELNLVLPSLLFPLVFATTNMLDKTLVQRIQKHTVFATTAACLWCLGYGVGKLIQTGDSSHITYQNLNILPHSYPYISALCCLLSILFLTEKQEKPLLPRRAVIAIVSFLSLFVVLLTIRVTIAMLFVLLLVQIFRQVKTVALRITISTFLLTTMVLSILFTPTLHQKWEELISSEQKDRILLDEDQSLGKSWGGTSIRFAIWECSADVIKAHPVWGVGTGDVQDELQQAYEKRKFYFASRYNNYNAHNQYIELWAGNGIPGVLAFLSCLLIPFFFFRKQKNFYSYGGFLLMVAGIACTESILEVNKGIVWYSFFNSIFAFGYFNKATPE